MSLDRGLAQLLQLIEDSAYPPTVESTPVQARKAMRAMTCDLIPEAARHAVGSIEDVTAGERPCRVYRPAGEGRFPTLVYFHGGGFVVGDLDTHDQFCRRICADAEAVVLSVDYRLAPEHPFPAAVVDAHAALLWASDHWNDLGGTPVIGVGGDSAGGNLAAVVAQAEPRKVAAQVLIYPATDAFGSYPSHDKYGSGYFLEMDTLRWFIAHYLSGSPAPGADDVRHSPLRAARRSLSDQPRALVVTAQFDPLRDEGEAYVEALRSAGVRAEHQRYGGMIHGFVDMGLLSPGAQAACDDLIARVRALLHGGC